MGNEHVLWLVRESPKITEKDTEGYTHIVSYNYRHLVPQTVCEKFDGRAVNLHISLLPWNRGADPNLWSWVDRTPKGITIHYLAPELDGGDILRQQEVTLTTSRHTLRSSYDYLHTLIRELFMDVWPEFLAGKAPRYPQIGTGSIHHAGDAKKIYLPWGWDTPVQLIQLTG